jgi:hypothetical protein
VAIAVTFVIILLSMAAVTQSIDSTNQSAVAGKQVNSTDAAEAGVQAEINAISNAVTNGATSIACPSSSTVGSGGETYKLSYVTATGTTSPSPNSTFTNCTGGALTMPSSSTTGETYLIAVQGRTSSTGTGTGTSVTEELQVYVPPTGNYSQSSLFPDAIFAGYTNTDGGGTTVSEPSGSSYGTYDGLGGSCGSSSSSSSYAGNFNDFSFNPSVNGEFPGQSDEMVSSTNPNGTPTSTFTNCSIGGDLDDNGTITFTGGSVGGNMYTGNGPLTISNATVGQSIYALYNETLTNTTVGGNVEGGDFTSNNSTINGNVYATNANSYENSSGAVVSQAPGAVNITGGVIKGSIYATGVVNITNATVQGSIYENCTGSTSSASTCEVYLHDVSNAPVVVDGNIVTNSTVPASTYAIVNAASTSVYGTEYAAGAIRTQSGYIYAYHQNDTSLPSNPSPPTAAALTALVNTQYTGYSNGSGCTSTTAAGTAQVVSDPSLTVYGQESTLGAGCTFFPQYYGSQSTLAANVNASLHGSRVNSFNIDNQWAASWSNIVFPTLNVDQNAFASDTAFCAPPSGETKCVLSTYTYSSQTSPSPIACNEGISSTPANAMCYISITDCNQDISNYVPPGQTTASNVSALQAIVDNMERPNAIPTVIYTSCEFNWNGGLTLNDNLAIYDSSGFDFQTNAAISSGDGNVHQFFAIVPSSFPTYSTAATLGSTSLAAAPYVTNPSTAPPTGMDACTVSSVTDGPDIVIDGNLTDSSDLVQDFLYTPQTICLYGSGTSAMSGKLYAGYQTYLTDGSGASLTDTLTSNTASLNPWFGTATQSSPTVTFVKKSAGS